MEVLSRENPGRIKTNKKQCNRRDVRKIQMTMHFFESSGPKFTFSQKKSVFRYGLGESVYQMLDLSCFSVFKVVWHREERHWYMSNHSNIPSECCSPSVEGVSNNCFSSPPPKFAKVTCHTVPKNLFIII